VLILKFKKISVLISLLILLPSLVFAASFPTFPSGGSNLWVNLWDFVQSLFYWFLTDICGITGGWLTASKVLYMIILPFLSVWLIVYGFMAELRIFRRARKVNGLLAFLIAFSTLPTHLFFWYVNIIFNILGIWSVVAFGLIFLSGTWYYFIRRKSDWVSEASIAQTEAAGLKSIRDELKTLLRQKKELAEEISYEKDPKKLDKLIGLRDKMDTEINKLRGREKTVKDATG